MGSIPIVGSTRSKSLLPMRAAFDRFAVVRAFHGALGNVRLRPPRVGHR